MKKIILFLPVLTVYSFIWAWKSLKESFDPVTVDQLSHDGKGMRFHNTSRSVGFYLSDRKYLVSRV